MHSALTPVLLTRPRRLMQMDGSLLSVAGDRVNAHKVMGGVSSNVWTLFSEEAEAGVMATDQSLLLLDCEVSHCLVLRAYGHS